MSDIDPVTLTKHTHSRLSGDLGASKQVCDVCNRIFYNDTTKRFKYEALCVCVCVWTSIESHSRLEITLVTVTSKQVDVMFPALGLKLNTAVNGCRDGMECPLTVGLTNEYG